MNKNTCIDPYLDFDGRADEAIAFYQAALGAELLMCMRFKDNPEPQPGCSGADQNAEKVMHAALRIGDSTLMLSDGRCTGRGRFEGINLSLQVATEAEAEQRFQALAQGGEVQMALARTFFSPKFGMVTDRFGVTWMILAHHA